GTAGDSGSGIASVAFQRSPAGAGTWTTIATDTTSPYSVSWDTTGVTDGLYDLRAVATDKAGNQTTSTVVTNRRVDNTNPTGSLTAPANGAAVRATITVSANSADTGSGVASAAFQRSPAGAGSWTTIATVNASPYQTNLDTTTLTDGNYDLRVITTDNAGNTFTSATRTVTVDNTNPTAVVLTDPGANVRGTVTLSSTASDGGSG